MQFTPECDHGICNVITLEVQVKLEDLKMDCFLLPDCHAVTKVQRFVFFYRLILTLTLCVPFASVLQVGALTE